MPSIPKEKGFTLRNYFEMLFMSETRALISWNLIIHKELSAKQLKNLINKDSSTITRNLRSLEEEGLVFVSKTENVRNLTINFWKLTPNNVLKNLGDLDTLVREALMNKDLELMKLAILAIQRNLENILNQKSLEINEFIQNILAERELMSVAIMDEKTGTLFRNKLYEFICKFQEEYKLHSQSLDEIGPESIFTFVLASPFPKLRNNE